MVIYTVSLHVIPRVSPWVPSPLPPYMVPLTINFDQFTTVVNLRKLATLTVEWVACRRLETLSEELSEC